jgi:hypothetical protein
MMGPAPEISGQKTLFMFKETFHNRVNPGGTGVSPVQEQGVRRHEIEHCDARLQ